MWELDPLTHLFSVLHTSQVRACSYTANRAVNWGGAVQIANHRASNITFLNSSFHSNTALGRDAVEGGGGALHLTRISAQAVGIIGLDFYNNSATDYVSYLPKTL